MKVFLGVIVSVIFEFFGKIIWSIKRNEFFFKLLSEEVFKMMILFFIVEERKNRKERSGFVFFGLEFWIMRVIGGKG